MRQLLLLSLCVLTAFPYASTTANNFSDRPDYEITDKTITVTQAVLDAGRVRKQVAFRGNKSARFAEFENLDLAPQQIYAKSLLNSEVAIDENNVVNYADLPEANATAQAVEKVETKITKREGNNPAIAGYGRANRDVYGALRAKRAKDARKEAALKDKLDQFQVKATRMQEKINPRSI